MTKPTIVDDITEQLAYRIAAGQYPPGTLLPSVRQVAVEFATSTPSANSALGRLAALGFVEARRGLGNVVRDIQLYGGIDTTRVVFRFARRVPDQAARIFADMIDMDHSLVMQAIRTFVADPHKYDMTQAENALNRLELLTSDPAASRTEVIAAELHMLRHMFACLGKPGYLSLFNTLGEVILAVPEAGAAFYVPAEPEYHVLLARTLLELAKSTDDLEAPDIDVIDTLMREYHDRVAEAFRDLISKPPTEPA